VSDVAEGEDGYKKDISKLNTLLMKKYHYKNTKKTAN
jgi:hypothetical protein